MTQVKNTQAKAYIFALLDAKLLAETSVILNADRAQTKDIVRVGA